MRLLKLAAYYVGLTDVHPTKGNLDPLRDPDPVATPAEYWSSDDVERMFCAALLSLHPDQCTDYTTVIHSVTTQYIRYRDGLDIVPEVLSDLTRRHS